MRKRMIHPRFFRSLALFNAEAETGLPLRVAYAGMWGAADREGRFRWVPHELKLDVLPYDSCDFGAVLDALEEGGWLRSYLVDGQKYGIIVSFHVWQSPHKREAQSFLPPMPKPADPSVSAQNAETPDNPVADNALQPGTKPKNPEMHSLGSAYAQPRLAQGMPWEGEDQKPASEPFGKGSVLPSGRIRGGSVSAQTVEKVGKPEPAPDLERQGAYKKPEKAGKCPPESVAVAVTESVTDTGRFGSPSGSGSRLEHLRAAFGPPADPADWLAVFALLADLAPAEQGAWVGRLLGYLDGLDMPAGRKATPATLGTAARDYPAGEPLKPHRFRRWVELAIEGTKPYKPKSKAETDEYLEAARRAEKATR